MGKWNRRYMPRGGNSRRRNYKDYNWSPPRDEPCPDPETEVWQDNVPLWEKKFCYLVGRMPWRKVLSTKNCMHGQAHSYVLNWDDSAGEEAFLNAKKRFWEEINGLPCETQLPNPDMYIDEIDWNPYIDPGLVRELDREYFNPDDKHYLPSASSSKGNNGWPDNGSNPWECSYVHSTAVEDKATGCSHWDSRPSKGDNFQECNNGVVKDKATGWNKGDNSVNDTSKLTKDDDPWEKSCTKGNVVKDSTWEGSWNKSWGSKPQNQSDVSKNWSAGSYSWRNEGNRWQGRGASSNSWNQKESDYHKPNYQNNTSYKAQEYGSHQESRVPNGRGNAWGPRHWDNYTWDAKDSGNISRGRGQINNSCRKREGPDHYATSHKGPRLHRGDFQSSRNWNAANNNRVSFGGQWS